MTFERTNDSPFARSDVLAEDYIPDEILGRNEELEQITEVLQQIIDDERPVTRSSTGSVEPEKPSL